MHQRVARDSCVREEDEFGLRVGMSIGVHRGPFAVWDGVGGETKGGELKAGSETGSQPSPTAKPDANPQGV